MSENSKTIPEMRHEVIDNTIKLELMLDDIIQISMGFEPEYQEEGEDENGKMTYYLSNEKEVNRFKEFFLGKLNLDRKFSIAKDIISQDFKEKVPENTWKDAQRLREIRNKFAHTLAPKYPLYKPGTIGISVSDFEAHSKHYDEWEKLYNEHTKLFLAIFKTFRELYYMNVVPDELEKIEDKK